LGHLTRALQQTYRYSITSAQPSSDSGGDNRSVFAAFRLMDQLDRGVLDDRRKTFH
jgi:hypothetical protein